MKIQHVFVFAGLVASIVAPRAYAMDTTPPAAEVVPVERSLEAPLPMRDLSRYAASMDDLRIPLADALALGVETRDRRVAFPDRDVVGQSSKRFTTIRDHRPDVFETETVAGATLKLRF